MHQISFVKSKNDIVKRINQLIYSNKLSKTYLLTDQNVYNIYESEINQISEDISNVTVLKVVTPGELSKNLKTVKVIIEDLVLNSFQRDSVIINIGGGVITDLGGFIASNYLRGIKYINVPTTIIGQVDAAIGGKTAINMFGIKNNFGSFYNPLDVIILEKFINTLEEIEILNGYGEVMKYSILVGDKNLIKLDYPDLVRKCINYKLDLVKKDLYDNNSRRYLNLGHTLGHGLEVALFIPHGIAVVYGIIFASHLSCKLNLSDRIFHNQLLEIFYKKFKNFNFISFNAAKINFQELIKVISRDKKVKNSQIEWLLPIGWGKILRKEINKDVWISALTEFLRSDLFE